MDEVWEYLGLAERTFREYQQEYPSVFSMLVSRPREDVYDLRTIFPTANDVDSDGWGPAPALLSDGRSTGLSSADDDAPPSAAARCAGAAPASPRSPPLQRNHVPF